METTTKYIVEIPVEFWQKIQECRDAKSDSETEAGLLVEEAIEILRRRNIRQISAPVMEAK